MSNISHLRIAFVAASLGALSACGEDVKSVDVGAGRPVTEPLRTAPPGLSTADRLGARAPAAAAGDPHGAPTTSLDWTAPGEWKELPAAPMREVGFQIGGDPNAQCTLAVFPGDTGGALANVNRWRGQMGLAPIDDAALAALPTRPLLGGNATLVELTGHYGGMGGAASVGDAKFVGLMRRLPAVSVFVKMVGPAQVVDAEAARFAAFCASVRMRGMGASPHGAAPAAALPGATPPAAPSTPPPEGMGEAGGLRWKWPAGWSASPTERPMRLATFVVADAPKTDVALTVLAGDAGGLEANLNRWRGQMGQPPLTAAEVEALPRLDALGAKAVVLSTAGTFTSMSGETAAEQALLGAVIERGSEVVFVKATGPVPEIAKLRPAFDALVTSLTPVGDPK